MPRLLLFLLLTALVAAAFAPGVMADPDTVTETPATASDADRAEILRFVDELRAEAARIRGLEWKEEIPADLLTRDELRVRMEESIQKELDPEELERDTRILRRLGLLGPDEDILEMALSAMGDLVAGFYDPEEKRLFLIAGLSGDAQRPVVLHELIHALEDQHVGLESRFEPYEEDSDRLFAEKCITEGSAEHASGIYLKENPDVAKKYMDAQQKPEEMKRQLATLQKVPAFLILDTLLHYELGPAFVKRAVGDDFPGGIKALYDDPPVSQEQLLHPDKWFGETKDFPQEVVWSTDFAELAGEGWEKVSDTKSGELDLAIWLDFFLGFTKGKINFILMSQKKWVVPRARRAAEGWDGGRSYFMEKEGLPAVWIEATVFDTVDDAIEAEEAMLEALRRANKGDYVAQAPVEERDEAGDVQTRTVSWKGKHGPARLMRRGSDVIIVDGAPEALFEKIWAAAVATTFVKDPRDTWKPLTAEEEAARFAACDFVDEKTGLGLVLPGEAWKAAPYSRGQGAVAQVRGPGVVVTVTLFPMGKGMILPVIEEQMRQAYGTVEVADTKVAGAGGQLFTTGQNLIYAGGNDGHTLLLRADGSPEALVAVRAALDALAAKAVLK